MDPYVIALGLLFCVSAGLVAYALVPRGAPKEDAIKRRLSGRRGVDDEAEIKRQARDSAAAAVVRKATPVLTKLVMPASEAEQTQLRMKLACAGFRQAQAQTIFMASKTVAAVGCAILGLIAALGAQAGWQMIVGAVCLGGGLGMMLPNLWLSITMGARQQKIREGMPDTLDLLVVSVESGLALDAALKRVGDEMAPVHAELSEELRISTMEAQMGLPRTEALGNMARRTGVEELRSLVSVVTQAEKFGTSVAKALRNQAEALRTKRRQQAEERAQKTAVKLMIPLVLFIFPAMFVVLGGPAVINVMKAVKANPSLGG
jgi:tight adherence protein C